MALVKGIHHVCMKCDTMEKYEEAIRFYHETLKFPIVRQWPAGIMLSTGNGLIELFNNIEDRLPQGTIRHFALAADNVDALANRIEQAGYRITDPCHDVTIPSDPPFDIRIAFCIGPVGEEIELFEERS